MLSVVTPPKICVIEKIGERGFPAHRKREILQPFLQRLARVVTYAGDLGSIAVGQSERFENVVHIAGLEIEARGFARLQLAGTLKIGHSVLIENDFPDGQVGGDAGGQHGGLQPEHSSWHDQFLGGEMPRGAQSLRLSSSNAELDITERQASDSVR